MALRDIVLTSFFVLSLPVCFFRPFYGVLLWTIVAFLNPQAYTWSAFNVVPLAQMVAIPTIIGVLVFIRRGWDGLTSREVVLLGMLWIWFTFTTVASTSTPLFAHHAEDTWYRWSFVSKILLMTVITIPIVNTFERLRLFLIAIAGCFGVYVAKTFPFILMTGGVHRLYGPPNSMIADNNDFGLALNMTLPLFFFLAQTESRRWARRLFGVLFLITIPAIFFTYSRGALVGLVGMSILMFIQSRRRMFLAPAIVFGVLIALLFAPESWKERMNPTREDAVDASAKARLNAWAFSRQLAADFPITGGGFATFTPELFDRYAPAARNIHGPHSVYFQVLAEHGYVGLALYLALVISCLATARRLVKMARYRQDHTIASYANMLRLSMAGFLISGIFLGRAYFDYFFSIVACLVILNRVALIEWTEPATDDLEEIYEPGGREVAAPYNPAPLWGG